VPQENDLERAIRWACHSVGEQLYAGVGSPPFKEYSYEREPTRLSAGIELSRAASSMDRLHIELLATRPLDFRDAPCFAATCTVARTAILSGPLLLWTDIERMITVAQLERLLQLIAWCGRSVRSLRLDQQPRVLWAKHAIARAVRAGTGDTAEVRREAHRQAMEQMPWASVRVLQAIRRCCPRLEELAFHGWVAYGGSDTRWAASLAGELSQLPRLGLGLGLGLGGVRVRDG